jgi:hypothetical protein
MKGFDFEREQDEKHNSLYASSSLSVGAAVPNMNSQE